MLQVRQEMDERRVFSIEDLAKKHFSQQWGTLDEFATAAEKMIAAGEVLDKSFLTARTRILEFEKAVADATPGVVRLGGDMASAGQTIEEIADASKRVVVETEETIGKLYATSQVLGKEVDTIVASFNNIGINTANIGKNVEKSVEYVRGLGLNAKTIMGDVLNNMDAMNRYQFEGGVQGLTKMAAQASMLKFDMKNTLTFADELYKPEKAIEVASAFQRLGIAVGDLTDPFTLMNKSINDPSGLQDSLIKATRQFVSFNAETKSFSISPEGMMKMKELASATGISAAELSKAAIASADLGQRLSKVNLDIPEDDRTLLANMAVMRDGEYQVKLVDEQGKETWKNLSDVQKEEFDKLKKEQRDAPKTMEDIQRSQLTVLQSIDKNFQSIRDSLSLGMASTSLIRRNAEGIRNIAQSAGDAIASKFKSSDISAGLEGPINKISSLFENIGKIKTDKKGEIAQESKEKLNLDLKELQSYFDENKTAIRGQKGYAKLVEAIQQISDSLRPDRSEVEKITKSQFIDPLLKLLQPSQNVKTEPKKEQTTKSTPVSVTPLQTQKSLQPKPKEEEPLKRKLPLSKPTKLEPPVEPKKDVSLTNTKEIFKSLMPFPTNEESVAVNIVKAGTYEGTSLALAKYSASPELRMAPVKAFPAYLDATSKAQADAQKEIIEKPKQEKLSQTQKKTEELMTKQTTEITSSFSKTTKDFLDKKVVQNQKESIVQNIDSKIENYQKQKTTNESIKNKSEKLTENLNKGVENTYNQKTKTGKEQISNTTNLVSTNTDRLSTLNQFLDLSKTKENQQLTSVYKDMNKVLESTQNMLITNVSDIRKIQDNKELSSLVKSFENFTKSKSTNITENKTGLTQTKETSVNKNLSNVDNRRKQNNQENVSNLRQLEDVSKMKKTDNQENVSNLRQLEDVSKMKKTDNQENVSNLRQLEDVSKMKKTDNQENVSNLRQLEDVSKMKKTDNQENVSNLRQLEDVSKMKKTDNQENVSNLRQLEDVLKKNNTDIKESISKVDVLEDVKKLGSKSDLNIKKTNIKQGDTVNKITESFDKLIAPLTNEMVKIPNKYTIGAPKMQTYTKVDDTPSEVSKYNVKPETIKNATQSLITSVDKTPQKSDIFNNLQNIIKNETMLGKDSGAHMTFGDLSVKIDVTGVNGMTKEEIQKIFDSDVLRQKITDAVVKGQKSDEYNKNSKRPTPFTNTMI